MKAIILFTVFAFSLGRCSDSPVEHDDSNETLVTLIDLTGLDGCGWAFVKEDDKRLEPINLHKFTIELIENQQYLITYHETDGGSICMVGPMIEIATIEKRK